jgi:hypothetical protein
VENAGQPWLLIMQIHLPNRTQERLPDKSATVIPLIIAHDRMVLLVVSGGHQAYPVYLTLGNIDKSVRRKSTSQAMVLLSYLPVNEFLYVKDKDERSHLKCELTHRAMEKLFEELHVASKQGVETRCTDGQYRRAYLIVAGMVLDNEDQVLAAGILSSGCPKCKTTYHNRGSGKLAPPRTNHETLCAMCRDPSSLCSVAIPYVVATFMMSYSLYR